MYIFLLQIIILIYVGKIKSLLCSIGIKHQEIQKEKHESEFDCTIENDWKKRVELIQKKRITSL